MCYIFGFLLLDRRYTILNWLLKEKRKEKDNNNINNKAVIDLSGCMRVLLSVFIV